MTISVPNSHRRGMRWENIAKRIRLITLSRSDSSTSKKPSTNYISIGKPFYFCFLVFDIVIYFKKSYCFFVTTHACITLYKPYSLSIPDLPDFYRIRESYFGPVNSFHFWPGQILPLS